MNLFVLISLVITFSCYDAAPTNVSDTPTISLQLGPFMHLNDIREWQDLYFLCDVNPKTTTVHNRSWFLNNKTLTQDVKSGILIINNVLILQNVNKTMSGNYSCQAETEKGTLTSKPLLLEIRDNSTTGKLDPDSFPDAYLYLRSTPASPRSDYFDEGIDVYFECLVTPDPKKPYKIFWYHDGYEVLYNAEAGILLSKGILVLQRITRDRRGNYTCEVQVEGQSQNLISNAVLMRVKYEMWPPYPVYY